MIIGGTPNNLSREVVSKVDRLTNRLSTGTPNESDRGPADVTPQPVDSTSSDDAVRAFGDLEAWVAQAAQQAVSADQTSAAEYVAAATEAQQSTEMTPAIRDRAIAAFDAISRMQI